MAKDDYENPFKIKDPNYHKESKDTDEKVDVIGPISFWLALLVLGFFIELYTISFSQFPFVDLFKMVGGYILYLPGCIVLPLIISLWVGHRVGLSVRSIKSAPFKGLINAIYIDLIYVVAIFILYFILIYVSPSFATIISTNSFLYLVLAIPVLIVLILVPLMAMLSAARDK